VGYDKFAKYYNLYWTRETPTLFEKVLTRLVLPSLPSGAEVLDLCCGTGQLSERLAAHSFNVTGVDCSEEMLAFAAQNAPSVLFSLQNAETFSFPRKFSAVISLFDSVNHFLSEEALLNLFSSVRRALKPNGIFFFDINGIAAFEDDWEEGFSMVDSASACIVKPLFDPVSGDVRYHITIFERGVGGDYTRRDTTVEERYYTNDIILSLLRKCGFNEVSVFDGAKDLKMPPFKGRIFFMAR
jgi:SAM-dependent methyltransferase